MRRDVLARNMFEAKPPPHRSDKLVKTVAAARVRATAGELCLKGSLLRTLPSGKRVLGYNEFALRVAIRKPPPWEDQAPPIHHGPTMLDPRREFSASPSLRPRSRCG